jgi:hypothetical protein
MKYVDMHKLSEDERIKFIGTTVMQKRISTWCLTDDEPGKIERYRKKLSERFPLLVLGEETRRNFPVKGTGGFTVNPPPQSNN